MICHHYRCVFVHIPKTAGQSIEHVFLNLLNLTWETRAPLLLRYNDISELGPPRLAHLKAHDYVRYKYMTQEQFDGYFKFTFVRNPWDRLVSIYNFMRYYKKYPFKKFVMNYLKGTIWNSNRWFVGPQWEFVFDDNGELLVDFMGRFENLQTDFNHVCQRIGLPPTQIAHENKSEEKTKREVNSNRWFKFGLSPFNRDPIPSFRNYQNYYDDESKQLVAQLYKRDIELFGYSFENAPPLDKAQDGVVREVNSAAP